MPAPVCPRNADGLTYGSAADATTPENEPDLILVFATNRMTGYVYKTQLDPKQATNPAHAVQMMREAASATGRAAPQIPVYLSDGRTQIGWFAFSG